MNLIEIFFSHFLLSNDNNHIYRFDVWQRIKIKFIGCNWRNLNITSEISIAASSEVTYYAIRLFITRKVNIRSRRLSLSHRGWVDITNLNSKIDNCPRILIIHAYLDKLN